MTDRASLHGMVALTLCSLAQCAVPTNGSPIKEMFNVTHASQHIPTIRCGNGTVDILTVRTKSATNCVITQHIEEDGIYYIRLSRECAYEQNCRLPLQIPRDCLEIHFEVKYQCATSTRKILKSTQCNGQPFRDVNCTGNKRIHVTKVVIGNSNSNGAKCNTDPAAVLCAKRLTVEAPYHLYVSDRCNGRLTCDNLSALNDRNESVFCYHTTARMEHTTIEYECVNDTIEVTVAPDDTGFIIGVTVAGVIVVLLGLGVWCAVRRRQKAPTAPPMTAGLNSSGDVVYSEIGKPDEANDDDLTLQENNLYGDF